MYSDDVRNKTNCTFYIKRYIFRANLMIFFGWLVAIYYGSLSQFQMVMFVLSILWLQFIFLFKLVRKVTFSRSYVEIFYWLRKKIFEYSDIYDVSFSEEDAFLFGKKTHTFYKITIQVINETGCVVIDSRNKEEFEAMCCFLKNNSRLK